MIPPPKPRKGHGALSNPDGRFELRRIEAVDDGWTIDADEEVPPLATTVTAEHAKSIISRNDSPDIPFEQSINPYRGCGHACVYCLWGDAKILMVDGGSKLLGDLTIGDEIVGTRRRGHYWRYVKTRVLAHWATHKPAYRLTLANGTAITASASHRFLVAGGWRFVTATDGGHKRRPYLRVGSRLLGPGMPERGALTGRLKNVLAPCGELNVSCAQLQDSLRTTKKLVASAALGAGVWKTDLNRDCFDARGSLRGGSERTANAERVTYRSRTLLEQLVETSPALEIVELEPLGVWMPMYDITTGTGDFIANGVISHNCYARPAHSYMNLSPGLDFETKLFYKENAAELLKAELSRPRYICKAINLGANTDPYQPIERRLKVTRSILEVLQEFRHPVTIVTKGHLIERDLDILAAMARDNLASVHVSVTTLDPELKRILEPRAPSHAARLHAIRCLKEAGVPVGALVAPVIPAVNDREIEHILEAVAGAGACRAAYVMLRLPYEVKDLFREWLERHYPLRAAHVMSLVRDIRGGRDNDPRFGSRMIGTGAFADLVRRRFDVACRRFALNAGRGSSLDTKLFRVPQPPAAQLNLGF
jgi:DNA repair photolyase